MRFKICFIAFLYILLGSIYGYAQGDYLVSYYDENEVRKNNPIEIIITPFEEIPVAVDADSNYYAVVKIGKSWWMAENLRTTKFSDGNSIPLIEDVSKWNGTSSSAYCWYYNNEMEHKNEFGALYNWYAVATEKLCPTGWHVPTDEEWKQLEICVGISYELTDSLGYRGANAAIKLKKYPFLWRARNLEAATNESGFAALPGGVRNGSDGRFYGIHKGAEWWTSSEYKYSAWMRGIIDSNNDIRRYAADKRDGRSVRCVED